MAEIKTTIFSVNISQIDLEKLIHSIVVLGKNRTQSVVAYVNIYAMNLAFDIPWFRNFLNSSDIVFCDGYGVSWAAKFLYNVKLARFTPPDWLPLLAQECAKNHLSMYLLGAKSGVAEKAAEFLSRNARGLEIKGTNHGYFEKSTVSLENEGIIKQINQLKPDILLVGFGMPLQERWIMENQNELSAAVILPVGAAFDYLAGSVKRAPKWMTDNNLEWLGRLLIEPKRLWRRYIIGIPLFFWRIFLQRFGLIKYPH